MTQRNSFNYSAAEQYAREAGVVVVQVCHAALPAGCGWADAYGNRLTASTVYIGAPGAMPRDCAYGRSVHSIHQTATPGIGDALSDIAEALVMVDTFQTRAAYEEYFLPGCRGAADIDGMAVAWRDYSNTAHRARKCLPPSLLAAVLRLAGLSQEVAS